MKRINTGKGRAKVLHPKLSMPELRVRAVPEFVTFGFSGLEFV